MKPTQLIALDKFMSADPNEIRIGIEESGSKLFKQSVVLYVNE